MISLRTSLQAAAIAAAHIAIVPIAPAQGATYGGNAHYPIATWFPSGAVSFADRVLDYDWGFMNGPMPTPGAIDPAKTLGIPDHMPPWPYVGACVLGAGGRITLAFTDNLLANSGTGAADLAIYEDPQVFTGADPIRVSVRPADGATRAALLASSHAGDPEGFFFLGTGGPGQSFYDVDAAFPGFAAGALRFDAVRILDDDRSALPPFPGAELDAVGAITSLAPDHQPNTAAARATWNGKDGPPFPIHGAVDNGISAALTLTVGGAPDAPWLLALAPTGLAPAPIPAPGIGIVDLDVANGFAVLMDGIFLGTGTFFDFFARTWTNGEAEVTLPLPAPAGPAGPALLGALQVVIADPASAAGFSLTAATELTRVTTATLAVHVAPDGSDANPGTAVLPKRTILAGLNAAQGAGSPYPEVRVASGVYAEAPFAPLVIRGGFDRTTWTRRPGDRSIIRLGTSPATATFSNPFLVQGFDFRADHATAAGADSIAVLLAYGTNLVFEDCRFVAGDGAAGVAGAAPVAPASGPPAGGLGGAGAVVCPSPTQLSIGGGGQPGSGGAPGGIGAAAGLCTCTPETNHLATSGAAGFQGPDGVPGAAAAAGSAAGFEWTTGAGGDGQPGVPGASGGGGGGGIAIAQTFAPYWCAPGGDGGFGGAGGQAGSGGQGGQGGGASFAVLLIGTSATFTDCSFVSGIGGAGGAGLAATAGLPGQSGQAGFPSQLTAVEPTHPYLYHGAGFAGGAGGGGGHGGGGAGGAGGPSYGVFRDPSSVAVTSGASFFPGGGGAGGAGGMNGSGATAAPAGLSGASGPLN